MHTAPVPSMHVRRARTSRAVSAPTAAIAFAVIAAACGSPPPAAPVDDATALYVAPGGWSGGDGTKEHPLDLKSALSPSSPVKPGGTVFLRGGAYKIGAITSEIAGTEQAPITVRPYPGETAVLDGAQADGTALTLLGDWTVFRDFEMTNSNPQRSGPRPTGVDVRGKGQKVINLVVHDFGNGITLGSDAVDAEVYGSIVYYNGTMPPGGPQGHGIVGQNKTGVRRLTDNVVFGQFGSGIRAYASDQGFLNDFQLEGNVASNNGIGGSEHSVLLGGNKVAERSVLTSNYAYDNPGAGINLGYAAGCVDLVAKDNYFAVLKGGYSLQLVNCSGTLQGNVFVGATRGINDQTIVTQTELAAQYPGNEFRETATANKVVVRANKYTKGRGHVIVFNWEHAKEVRVDLPAGLLDTGATYELRDVRNLAGPPIVSGTYQGEALSVPMEGLTASAPIGWQPVPAHTAPEFATFLLTSRPAETTSFFTRLRAMVGL